MSQSSTTRASASCAGDQQIPVESTGSMNPTAPDRSNKDEVVSKLNANDVLFGRGSGPNDHEGNIRFRQMVSERKAEYMATNHRQTKAKIAREIVDAVLSKNGRFLKKIEGAEAKRRGIAKGTDAWMIADDETIMEKAKQALRQHRDKEKSPRSSPVPTSKSQPPVKLENYDGRAIPPPPFASSSAAGVAPRAGLEPRPSGMGNSAFGYAAPLHPNPYEPIPLRLPTDPQQPNMAANWNEYAAAAIAAQAPNYQPQPFDHISGAISATTVPLSHPPSMPHMVESMPPPTRIADMTAVVNSTSVADNSRRESLQVTDLMDNLRRMKTKEKMEESSDTFRSSGHESTDTMGTIEPLPMHGSREGQYGGPQGVSMSMSSGTLNLMKGALADSSSTKFRTDAVTSSSDVTTTATGNSSIRLSPTPAARAAGRRSIHIEDKDFFVNINAGRRASSTTDMSLSLSQVWNEKRSTFLHQAISEENDEDEQTATSRVARRGGGDTAPDSGGKKKLADDPRPVGLMEDEPDNMSSLGKSSMSILHIAMGEDSGLTTAHESVFSDMGD